MSTALVCLFTCGGYMLKGPPYRFFLSSRTWPCSSTKRYTFSLWTLRGLMPFCSPAWSIFILFSYKSHGVTWVRAVIWLRSDCLSRTCTVYTQSCSYIHCTVPVTGPPCCLWTDPHTYELSIYARTGTYQLTLTICLNWVFNTAWHSITYMFFISLFRLFV